MCRQSFGSGPNTTDTGWENTAIWWRCRGQCFGDGGAGVGDWSEKRISKSTQRYQRSATAAKRDDGLVTISAAEHATNIQSTKEAIGVTYRTIATIWIEFGYTIATASLKWFHADNHENHDRFVQRNSYPKPKANTRKTQFLTDRSYSYLLPFNLSIWVDVLLSFFSTKSLPCE